MERSFGNPSDREPSDQGYESPASPIQDGAIEIFSQEDYGTQRPRQAWGAPRSIAPQGKLKQATLMGGRIEGSTAKAAAQSSKAHNWPLANRNETPTHHELDEETLQTWVYPTNLGQIRTYQFNIVARGLYHNLLVALPTGLGKTFIAATIMLNWFRWTKSAQIVFVAPTKPLVSQQVDACFNTVGIPRSATTMLTGGISPGLRAEEWNTKRVFFMTPQTIVNDLKTGICDPKKIVLIVVDEAHRATGAYAYVEVIKFMRRFNTSFRVLALTATPGSKVESVQEVIDGLSISRTEIRTEESLDIREYVHPRNIETILFENSDEMVLLMDMYSKALQPLVTKLHGLNAYYNRDPMRMTPYGMNEARGKWMNSHAGRNANMGVKGMVNAIFTVCAKLAHPIDLLKFHGIGPFYQNLESFRKETDEGSGGKYRKQVIEDENFRKMMSMVSGWVHSKDFVGHPKMEYVQHVVLTHFVDVSEGRAGSDISPAHTRVMIFAHFRDSAEEVVKVLKRNEPMIRPHVFVGQANAKGSEGMGQKHQLEVIEKFKNGVFNTLVATSIGEEGLDIGEVDLIICYDASASPIRMLQRMGRTGRKRAGNIVVTLMKGKEADSFAQAKDNYQKMQQMISEGDRFQYHDDLAPRIVPKGINPVVDKRVIEIPVENTQSDLPEPKKRGKAPKRPPKKFHMPDGVRTGFTKASRLDDPREEDDSGEEDRPPRRRPAPAKPRSSSPDPLPPDEDVFLSDVQRKELDHLYLQVAGEGVANIDPPRLDAFPAHQRQERGTGFISHGRATRNVVRALNAMQHHRDAFGDEFEDKLHSADKDLIDSYWEQRAHPSAKSNRLENTSASVSPAPRRRRRARSTGYGVHDSMSDPIDDEDDGADLRDFIDDGGSQDSGGDLTGRTAGDRADDDPESPTLLDDDAEAPSPNKLLERPFFEPTKYSQLASQESADLPDVEALLGKTGLSPGTLPGFAKASSLTKSSGQRRGKRKVVDSDDDDDAAA